MRRSQIERRTALKREKGLNKIGKRGKRLASGDKKVSESVKGEACIANGRMFGCCEKIDPAHILGRDDESIRHDPRNYVPLCRLHHDYYTSHNEQWLGLIEELYPGRLDYLYAKRRGAA